ncbi:MAG: MFS transporter [Pseudomonadota bacterium]
MATAQDPAASAAAADGEILPPLQQRLATLAVACAIALSAVSLTGMSVALPVIARELGLPPATAVWLVSGFQLTLVATLFPFAALGEQWGYRRTFAVGLVLIAVASVICTTSDSLAWLLGGRILQGIGASAVMAVNPALLRLSVPAAALGRVLGTNALVVALATAFGPSLAAMVLSAAHWRWLFALNVPWAVMALGIGWFVLPRRVQAPDRRFDLGGALLNIVAFVLAAAALDRLAAGGWVALSLLAGALVSGWILFQHQRHRSAPLLPLDLLRDREVSACAGASVFAFAAQMAALVSLPFLLHDVFHLSLMATGTTLMAWPLAVAFMAPVAGRCVDRQWSSTKLCIVGGAMQCLALLVMAGATDSLNYHAMVLLMVACGIGFGFFQTPNNRAMLGATPRERSGSAGGLQATARLTGQTLGAAVVGMSFRLNPGDARAACAMALLAAAAFAAASAGFSLRRQAVQSTT